MKRDPEKILKRLKKSMVKVVRGQIGYLINPSILIDHPLNPRNRDDFEDIEYVWYPNKEWAPQPIGEIFSVRNSFTIEDDKIVNIVKIKWQDLPFYNIGLTLRGMVIIDRTKFESRDILVLNRVLEIISLFLDIEYPVQTDLIDITQLTEVSTKEYLGLPIESDGFEVHQIKQNAKIKQWSLRSYNIDRYNDNIVINTLFIPYSSELIFRHLSWTEDLSTAWLKLILLYSSAINSFKSYKYISAYLTVWTAFEIIIKDTEKVRTGNPNANTNASTILNQKINISNTLANGLLKAYKLRNAVAHEGRIPTLRSVKIVLNSLRYLILQQLKNTSTYDPQELSDNFEFCSNPSDNYPRNSSIRQLNTIW